jgi:hypothetical protein
VNENKAEKHLSFKSQGIWKGVTLPACTYKVVARICETQFLELIIYFLKTQGIPYEHVI